MTSVLRLASPGARGACTKKHKNPRHKNGGGVSEYLAGYGGVQDDNSDSLRLGGPARFRFPNYPEAPDSEQRAATLADTRHSRLECCMLPRVVQQQQRPHYKKRWFTEDLWSIFRVCLIFRILMVYMQVLDITQQRRPHYVQCAWRVSWLEHLPSGIGVIDLRAALGTMGSRFIVPPSAHLMT